MYWRLFKVKYNKIAHLPKPVGLLEGLHSPPQKGPIFPKSSRFSFESLQFDFGTQHAVRVIILFPQISPSPCRNSGSYCRIIESESDLKIVTKLSIISRTPSPVYRYYANQLGLHFPDLSCKELNKETLPSRNSGCHWLALRNPRKKAHPHAICAAALSIKLGQ